MPEKKIIITQSNYIPWKGYFDGIAHVDEFIIYDDMQYTKRDWRNRNKINTPNGAKWLSIPVEVKGKFFQKINETQIAESNWNEKHWNQIRHNYSKADCFAEVKDELEALYQGVPSANLTEVNRYFIEYINQYLGIDTKILDSREFELVEGKTERLVDLCKKRGASHYYSGPAARNYMDESLFAQEGIEVHYFDYSDYPEYPQKFPTFESGVTILDMLFNLGKDTKKYMKMD